jgi:hypothetical protein
MGADRFLQSPRDARSESPADTLRLSHGRPRRLERLRGEYRRAHAALWPEFDDWVRQQGAPPLDDLEFIHTSPHLNLYLYTRDADYDRARPLGVTWHRLESCVRKPEVDRFEIPEALREGEGALVY